VSQQTGRRPVVPPVSASRRHGGRFALLALAALVSARIPLPWMAVALALVVAAEVEGVRTARAIAREGRRRGLLLWCVCGISVLSLIGLGVAGTLVLYPITYDRQECMSGANTAVAKAACQSEFDRRINRLRSALLRG
jgi:hypothetical protein